MRSLKLWTISPSAFTLTTNDTPVIVTKNKNKIELLILH